MAENAEKPKEETPVNDLPVPKVVGGVEEYASSEEFQRAHATGLKELEEKEKEQKRLTEKQRLRAVLDKYIVKYSDTAEVRKMGKENKKSADHNLDVAADVTEILRKIKNELR